MTLSKRITLCLILLNWLNSFSQQKNSKIIIDAITKLPIDFVYVTSNNDKIKLISNEKGRLIIINDPTINYYTFYKIGYEKEKILANFLSKNDTIKLIQKQINLNEVTVTSDIIKTVVKNKRFYVDDYKAISNNDFLIITSKINTKGFEVQFYKKDKGITFNRKFTLETNPGFFKDCYNNYHLLTKEASRQFIFTSDTTFDFLPKYSRSKFDSTLVNAVLKIDSSIIFKSKNKTRTIRSKHETFSLNINSFFLHYTKVLNKKVTNFYTLTYNDDMLNMIKNELADQEILLSASETMAGQKLDPTKYQKDIDFFEKYAAKPISAYMFKKNDTILIFDFQNQAIIFLNKDGQKLNTIKLNEDDFSFLHDTEIIYDELSKTFYLKSLGEDKSYLVELNIYSGRINKKIKLQKIFAKNLQVLNNKVYYLVKEHGWDDTSYLYEQNL